MRTCNPASSLLENSTVKRRWNDAILFAQKLSFKTGKKYRLPSEAEWKCAARSGTKTTYFWGDDEGQAKEYTLPYPYQYPVGQRKPNQFGLQGMHDNVFEWTQDCWNENYTGAPTEGIAWASVLAPIEF